MPGALLAYPDDGPLARAVLHRRRVDPPYWPGMPFKTHEEWEAELKAARYQDWLNANRRATA